MLNDPACLLGLSDGGAHCTSIVDAGTPSYMLTHWGRDRARGPRLPLEMLVKRQTSETANFFGLTDRGRLVPGLRADVNLIDFDALKLHKPELIHDMPANGRRFVQRVEGYEATLVAGRRSSSAANIPARCRANWCAPAGWERRRLRHERPSDASVPSLNRPVRRHQVRFILRSRRCRIFPPSLFGSGR